MVHYRTDVELIQRAEPEAVASRFDWVNAVTEHVLAAASQSGVSDIIETETNGVQVQAVRIDTTGWLVVLVVGKITYSVSSASGPVSRSCLLRCPTEMPTDSRWRNGPFPAVFLPTDMVDQRPVPINGNAFVVPVVGAQH